MEREKTIDFTYLSICKRYARLSRCLSREVGALILNPEGIVIGLGVNGPPRGTAHCDQLQICQNCGRIVHPQFDHGDPSIGPHGTLSPYCHYCQGPQEGMAKVDRCPRKMLGLTNLEECPAVHAEMNALLACARTNNSTKDCTVYLYPMGPCKNCAAMMIQAGVVGLVYPESDPYDELSGVLLAEAGVTSKKYPREELETWERETR